MKLRWLPIEVGLNADLVTSHSDITFDGHQYFQGDFTFIMGSLGQGTIDMYQVPTNEGEFERELILEDSARFSGCVPVKKGWPWEPKTDWACLQERGE